MAYHASLCLFNNFPITCIFNCNSFVFLFSDIPTLLQNIGTKIEFNTMQIKEKIYSQLWEKERALKMASKSLHQKNSWRKLFCYCVDCYTFYSCLGDYNEQSWCDNCDCADQCHKGRLLEYSPGYISRGICPACFNNSN